MISRIAPYLVSATHYTILVLRTTMGSIPSYLNANGATLLQPGPTGPGMTHKRSGAKGPSWCTSRIARAFSPEPLCVAYPGLSPPGWYRARRWR